MFIKQALSRLKSSWRRPLSPFHFATTHLHIHI